MNQWWERRSLKLRLAVWYAAVTGVVVALLASVVYETVEHRLRAEINRQLRIDFDLTEAQLDLDEAGNVRWLVHGAHGDEGFARLSSWFEVWSEDGRLLFRHWPLREADIKQPLPPPAAANLAFRTVELDDELYVQIMERPARLRGRGVIVRVVRDEVEMRAALRQIMEVFLIALPMAVMLCALGGFFIAGRSFAPVAAMAAQARAISFESLGRRLPNPNPHDELGQLATVFNATLERLENSFAELKRFTADASHELRTPLTALRAVGEAALREQNHPAISSMLEEAQSLEDLIGSLLALARMESVPLARAPVSVTELVAEVCESLRVLVEEREQVVACSGHSGIVVPADRALLRQAVMNLLHNAVRYAPIRSSILVEVTRQDTAAVIAFSDDGPGIAPEHQQKIFERFYRIDKARSREDGGHGLGLAIAKWAVERHGGRIELESAPGKGSVFRIRLPGVIVEGERCIP